MKIRVRILITLFCFALVISCRKDEYRFEEMPEDKPLVKNSVVANLMQRIALKDGSSDNIIDQASCITIKLPINLEVNGNQIVINTQGDFNTIKAIFDDSNTDTDTLFITFPIYIILEDFTEVLITSETELDSYRNNCSGENEDDDDIECIDFNYPITVTTYNTLIDKLGSATIESDKALFEFINDIEDYLVVNIDFPISMILFDGTLANINSLEDLQATIQNVITGCDEDDDYNFDDDDITETEENFIDLITQCDLKIDELESNEQHFESQFDGFKFTFNADGSVTATDALGTIYNGVWAVSLNNGLKFNIQFNDFSILSQTWRLKEINSEDNGTQIDLKFNEDELKLKQMCS